MKYDEDEILDITESKTSLRTDHDFFDEEASKVISQVISVKRIKRSKNKENWQILLNGKLVLLLKGERFTNQEKEFLRTVEGVKFLLASYKKGLQSVVKIKQELKRLL